jgi:hypothetical protein
MIWAEQAVIDFGARTQNLMKSSFTRSIGEASSLPSKEDEGVELGGSCCGNASPSSSHPLTSSTFISVNSVIILGGAIVHCFPCRLSFSLDQTTNHLLHITQKKTVQHSINSPPSELLLCFSEFVFLKLLCLQSRSCTQFFATVMMIIIMYVTGN